jgi:4-hydroxy-3-polyprenylbenzoate decarboxylase
MGTYVISVTGASGMAYAQGVLKALVDGEQNVVVVLSDAGRRVLALESGIFLNGAREEDELRLREWVAIGSDCPKLQLRMNDDVAAPEASGSNQVDGTVVVPCSCGTLSRIANGTSSNLIERAADVALKENRPLVLVPRETPLSLIHLKNMVLAREAGAVVLPACPGFYSRPTSIQDLVDFITARVLHHLGVDGQDYVRWKGVESFDLPGLENL